MALDYKAEIARNHKIRADNARAQVTTDKVQATLVKHAEPKQDMELGDFIEHFNNDHHTGKEPEESSEIELTHEEWLEHLKSLGIEIEYMPAMLEGYAQCPESWWIVLTPKSPSLWQLLKNWWSGNT